MSSQTGYPRITVCTVIEGNPHTNVVSNKPTTHLWSVLPGPLSNWLSQCETVKVSCPFTEPPAPVKIWTTETSWRSARHTLKTDVWLIQNKLPPEESIKDPSVIGWLVRKPCRACSVSRWTWELTEAFDFALLLLYCAPQGAFRGAMRCLHYLKTPSAAQRKTLGFSVLDLLPLGTFYSLLHFVCVLMSSLTCIWCIGTSRQHPV